MDVDDLNPADGDDEKLDEIANYLIGNKTICFKNQSRDERDLSDQEKIEIAKEIYRKSRLNFLARFGKYLKQDHLDFFKTNSDYPDNCGEIEEINMILSNLRRFHSKNDYRLKTKNRRYEALNKLIKENSYFSENEMMKRNPLLYEQLVGQYLSESEKKERDMHIEKDTLVKILLEGIERDITEDVLKKQIQEEKDDEKSSSSSNEDSEDDSFKSFKWGEFPETSTSGFTASSSSKWGEIPKTKKSSMKIKNPISKKKNALHQKNAFITQEERRLLKEEFTSIMHQNFLNGKDDYDYTTIDNNDEFDNIDILEHDEEDKYFDSEEPEDVKMEEDGPKGEVVESSEDELDIYMNALNQHPTVVQLSKDLEKM